MKTIILLILIMAMAGNVPVLAKSGHGSFGHSGHSHSLSHGKKHKTLY